MTTTKMLINTQRDGHLRVAIVKGTLLEDYQVEITEAGLCRGNIYRGIVANVQPSLNAAFVDIGEDRHAFLPVADVLPAAYHKQPPDDVRRPRIDQVLDKGKPIYVQVTKDGVGQKGAALNTNVALAGRYLVLAPFDDVRGISRKAEDDASRKKARERLAKLKTPDGMGVIVRTNGLDQNQTMLNRDLNALMRLWKQIKAEGSRGRGPKLLYSDQDLVVQALRDYLDSSIEQVVVDSDEIYEKAESYMQAFMPRSKTKLIRYQERQPLFSRYAIETQIDSIYERRAQLPGGGSIVIDLTEALTAIDVNSGRATQNADHDEAIFNVNVEAAQEVARQLRLRDIGGLVVVDFIDMRLRKHQRKLEKAIRDALKADRARTSVGRISSNGLLEINRQRIKQSLRTRTHRPCPTCQGMGAIPNPEFAALNLLGRLEARASTGLMEAAMVLLHPEIADALQNHHRRELSELEQEFQLKIEIISNPSLTRTQERIDWTHRENAVTPASRARPALSSTDLGQKKKDATRRKAAAGPADAAGAEAAPERPRRKRRRSRKRSESADADTPAAAEAQAAAPKAEADKEAKPKTRRRRAPRRRKSSSEGAAAPRRTAADGEPQNSDSASADADKPKPRRRRRAPRRRRPAAAAQDAEAAGRSRQDDSNADARPAPAGRRRRRPAADAGPKPARDSDGGAPAPRYRRPPSHRRSSFGDDAGPGERPGPKPDNTLRRDPPLSASSPERSSPAKPPEPRPAPVASQSPLHPAGSSHPGGPSEKLSSSRPLSRWLWWRKGDDDE